MNSSTPVYVPTSSIEQKVLLLLQKEVKSQLHTMSESLAAELLADFDDDENEEQFSDNERDSTDHNGLLRSKSKSDDFGMEIDGDEEADEDEEDADMGGMDTAGLEADDDAEARKSKVEKLQLGGVDDVRSVAGLMKILEPVLEVCGIKMLVFLLMQENPNLYSPLAN